MNDRENRRLWSAILLLLEMIAALSDEVMRTSKASSEQNDYMAKLVRRMATLNKMLDGRAEAEPSNADEFHDTVREITEGLLEERSNRPLEITIVRSAANE